MFKLLLHGLLIGCLASTILAVEPFTLVEQPAPPSLDGSIPWVEEGSTDWNTGEPTFDLPANEFGTAARGWFAVTDTHLLGHIVVSDDIHFGRSTGSSSWKDDCIQLAIDPLDNGILEGPAKVDVEAELAKQFPVFEKTDAQIQALPDKERKNWEKKKKRYDRDKERARKKLEKYNQSLDLAVYLDRDDAELCFGKLSYKEESFVWSFYHATPGREGARPLEYFTFTRDEDAKTSTYDLKIPWSEFMVKPGLSGAIRMAMKIHDRDWDEPPVEEDENAETDEQTDTDNGDNENTDDDGDSGDGEEPAEEEEIITHNSLYWGEGTAGKFQPFDFKRLAIKAPDHPVASVLVMDRNIRGLEDKIIVYLGATQGEYTLDAKYNDISYSRTLSIEQPMKQFVLEFMPPHMPKGLNPLTVTLRQGETVLSRTYTEVYNSSSEDWYAWEPQEIYSMVPEEKQIDRDRGRTERKLKYMRDRLSEEEIAELEAKEFHFDMTAEQEQQVLSVFHESPLDMSGWLDAPAGKHGRPKMVGDRFELNGEEIKFWGVNICSGQPVGPKSIAVGLARKMAKYGVNCIRMHKFSNQLQAKTAEGDSFFDPDALDRLDYLCAQLSKRGIYYGFDPFFHYRLSPYDMKFVENPEEWYEWKTDPETGERIQGRPKDTYGLVSISTELQELRLKWLRELMNHVNPYTGVAYNDDPALVWVELQNEDGIFWYNTDAAKYKFPEQGRDFCGRFSDWLKGKYGSQEKLVEAWGEEEISKLLTPANEETGEPAEGTAYYGMFKRLYPEAEQEHLEQRNILSIANPWFYTPFGLYDQRTKLNIHERLVDNVQFLLECQLDWYNRFETTMRDAGYDGALIGSCWIAQPGVTHFANLYTDAQVGMIDRHNYTGGGGRGWWISAGPVNTFADSGNVGGTTINAGMLQVKDRPFSLSEWTVTYPCQWRADAPCLMATYGMGLLGWDASYQFASDKGNWSNKVTKRKWDVNLPDNMGLYPALSRMVLRKDIREGDVVSVRRVCVENMMKTMNVGFDEDMATGGTQYGRKTFEGFVPRDALAIGKCLVEFVDEPQQSTTFDPETARDEHGAYQASNNQLRWQKTDPARGYILVDSKGTQGLFGFPTKQTYTFEHIAVEWNSFYGSLFVSALDKDKDLTSTKRAVLQAIARTRNTGMEFNELESELLELGKGPILMEPVKATVKFQREIDYVNILDHDLNRTGRTAKLFDPFTLILDTEEYKTPYFEIVFR